MFKKLPLWIKMLVVGAVVTAPLVATMAMLVKHTGYKIDFARWEKHGTRYLRPASRLLGAVMRYESATRKGALPNQPGSAQPPQLADEIDAELRVLESLDETLAGPLKTTPAELGAR